MDYIKLIYEIKGNKVNLFHPKFIKENKNKFIMIINNKILPISNEYKIEKQNLKFLEIKLIVLSKEKLDLHYMFFGCSALKLFSITSKNKKTFKDNKFEENYDNFINETNNYEEELENFSNNYNIDNNNSFICLFEDYFDNFQEEKSEQFSLLNSSDDTESSISLPEEIMKKY